MIHLIDSPFRSRKSKYFTVFGSERTFDLLVSNKFYPTILPASGKLISLTVTTENLENEFDILQKSYDKIIIADLNTTSEKDNFVTNGRFSIYDVSDIVYDIYLQELNFNLMSTQPVVVERELDGKRRNEIIGNSRHFQWTNYSHYGKQSIDVTFNIILVNFPRGNIRYGNHVTINFRGQDVHAVSVFGKMLVLGSNGTSSFVYVKLLFDTSLYNEIVKNDITVCVLQVYTLYNLRDGNKEAQSINFVTAVIPFFGSYEELVPFCCNQFSVEKFSRKCVIDKKMLERLRAEALENSTLLDKEVQVESRIYHVSEHQDVYEYSIIKPESILKFIQGALSTDTGRSLLEITLSAKDIKQEVDHLVDKLKSSPFIDGTLIASGLRRAILDSFVS